MISTFNATKAYYWVRLGGEGLEQRLGVFVAAMLAPHHGKDAELGVARRAAEDFHGVGIFFRREVVFGNQLWGDGGFGHGKILQLFCVKNFYCQQNFMKIGRLN